MNHTLRVLATLLLTSLSALRAADVFLVEDGRPRSEIVIAEKPTRTVRLAAQELQNDMEKISGAHLPIVTSPSTQAVHVFVGRSNYTDQLGITADRLKDGAYRIVSGADWLALLGEDTEFTPVEPWAKGNADLTSGQSQSEWDHMTGALWGLPNRLIYKDRFGVPAATGLPDAERAPGGKRPPLYLWSQDERGSFNAVCGFVMKLGARWYMPGNLGEVMPSLKTIALPKVDETVRPDFPIRQVNITFGVHGADLAQWAMRLGVRHPYGFSIAHGMAEMTDRDEVFAQHPDWFAQVGGKRTFKRGANNHLCYSNEELIAETVRNVRAQFDHFKMDVVSIMPPDGYTAICQCPLCTGKDSPERENRGLASDYIWGFVNRVAREVRQTHPDKKVLNCAYGIYSLPPLGIPKLEPNVVVGIVGGRRLTSTRPEEMEELRKFRESWQAKTDNPVLIFENYPFTDRGWYLPSFTPHTLGASINATKGTSQGEDIWLSVPVDFEKKGAGLNHFLIYFTTRMYWGGRNADVDAMFREYVRLFCGPAEAEMNAFFDYCEGNWQAMEKEKDKADTALALFEKAKAKADGVYAQRLALLDDYLKGLRNKSQQLGRLRGPVPVLRLVQDPSGKITIDGKLDEEAWTKCPAASTVKLRELETGRPPALGTTVKSFWIGHDLYFGIRCEERRGEKLPIGATRKDDSSLWYGDAVELLIETESHSYYQIAISPNGMITDLDRSATRDKWFTWDSNAEIATHIEDDHWDIEVRLPITEDENDPLHQIIGHKPTVSLPWHINICRQRLRDDGAEYSAFSPTGAADFHHAMKFATFYDGLSHQFEAAAPDDDFLEAMRKASELTRTGHREEALAAYTAAASGKTTPLQQSHGLELAAAIAGRLGRFAVADDLAARIPIDAVKKTVQMQNLLDQSKAAQAIQQFGAEDISKWPFWKIGDAAAARGRAGYLARDGARAARDLLLAASYLTDPNLKGETLLTLGATYHDLLQDDTKAMAAYRQVYDTSNVFKQCTAAVAIADILRRQGKTAEARAELNRIDESKVNNETYRRMLDKAKAAADEANK
ncbi:MAG: DUF4838 domain-containing protein [Chthoniobacter sp.]|uniref:DUF4838 domain-containing protein n=1 Tax=Chthoniobacter sp. TaxID=2510640 RepID=UPI0032AB0BAF